MSTYTVGLGWNPGELEEVELRAVDFPTAMIEARRGWGRAWSVVIVTDPVTDQAIDVAYRRSDGDLTPEQWVTRRLAPPAEVAIVSVDAFLAALQPNIVGHPGSTADRPVWILLDGMLYAPAQIGIDPEFGAVIIVPNPAPSGTHGMAGS